jgi:tetratricopeptide (TPR) repeat protein
MHLLGYPENSLQILQEGETLSKESKDEKTLLIFRSKLGSYYANHGEPQLALKYTESAFEEAEKLQNIQIIAPIACEVCNAYLYASEFYKMLDMGTRVLPLLEKAQQQKEFFGNRYNVYSGICALCVFACGMLGDFEKGGFLYEKGHHFASEARSTYGLGLLEDTISFLSNFRGDAINSIEHAQKGIKYFEETQAVSISGHVWTNLGYGHYLHGDLEIAKKHIEKGLKIQTEEGTPVFVSMHLLYLSIVYFEFGDFENAQNYADRALASSRKNCEKHWEGYSCIWLGRILASAKMANVEKVKDYLYQGIKVLDDLKLRPFSAQGYLFLGELYADNHQIEKALENVRRAEGMFQEMGMDYWLGKTRDILERL